MDEYSRECLMIEASHKQTFQDVLRTLAQLMLKYVVAKHIRSDNGPEFVVRVVRSRFAKLGIETFSIDSGRPWENGCVKRFNGKLRDELLNGRIFTTLQEAKVLTSR